MVLRICIPTSSREGRLASFFSFSTRSKNGHGCPMAFNAFRIEKLLLKNVGFFFFFEQKVSKNVV